MTRPDPYPFHRQDKARPVAPKPEPPSDWDVLGRLIVTAALIGIGVGLGLPLLRLLFGHH